MTRIPSLYETATLENPRGGALLISAAFPPAAEAGAARWEGFAPFLTAAGWTLDVVMEHPETLALVDWGRVERLPPGIRVAAVRRPLPAWFRALLAVNRMVTRKDSLAMPAGTSSVGSAGSAVAAPRDVRARLIDRARIRRDEAWITGAVKAANALLDGSQRLVISSGPPHDAHVAAARVARASGLPHIVDLRDPWMNPRGDHTAGGVDIDLVRFESRTLSDASLIVTNTIPMCEALAVRFPALRNRIVAIPNGSDLTPQPPPPQVAGEQFVVAHAGALYLDRDPRPLLRAVGRLKQSGTIDSRTFRLVFMGGRVVVDGRPIEDWAAEYGVADLFECRARGSREEARRLLQEAAVAVAFQGQTTTQIPAKVFEYVAFPLWLLALVGENSATGQLLRGSRALVHAIDDESGIARALEQCFLKFQLQGRPQAVGLDGRFSRERQAARLIELLERFREGQR